MNTQILPDFCRIFQIRPRRNVQGTHRLPRRVPGGSPQFAFSRKTPHTAPANKLASSSARPAAALRDKGKESMPDRQDHELLASEAVAGVGAAVDDVEARDGHDKPRVTAQL